MPVSPKRMVASPYREAALTWSRSSRFIQRVFFVLACAASIGLAGLVLFSPVVAPHARPDTWGRVLAIFAQDATLRRTAIASALGVLATACIFFRPHSIGPPVARLPRMRRPRREYDD